jgi:undecaprenyl-diphosphatase
MTAWEAALLGLVEGITEYLPVSSTGHLILVQRMLGQDGPAADAFAICIQAGAIAAVLVLYPDRLRQIGRGVLGGDPVGRQLGIGLVVAFFPAAVIGFLLDDWIESMLFGLWPVVAAWTAGALVMLAWGRWGRNGAAGLDSLTWRTAGLIGLAQCLALWPGTSRSLSTLLAGMLLGLTPVAAVEFSFLLGLLTLGAATAYAGLKHAGLLWDTYGPVPLAVGFGVAWISAMFAVRWLVRWLATHDLGVFAAWRLVIAAVAVALLVTGTISA